MEQHAQALVFAALLETLLNLVADLFALGLVGGVDVEEPRFAAVGLDLVLNPLDVAHRGTAIEVDADDVAARARQDAADGLSKTARSSEDKGPPSQGGNRHRGGGRHGNDGQPTTMPAASV